jgi:hypothetical protein
MPRSDLHRQKKSRNYAILLALAAFCAIVFVVTIIRLQAR